MSNAAMCDRILCPSHTVARSYSAVERFLVGRHRVRIIPYGISIEELAALPVDRDAELGHLGVDSSRVVFIHTGRMVPVKDQPFLIRLYGAIARQHPDVHLLMVGDGPCRPELERLVREEELGTAITFTGMVSRQGVYRLLKSSDVFVMTSRSEGLSVSLIEALGCGLPALLTDIPSFRETMKDGKGAVFIARDAPIEREAARILDQVVRMPPNRRRLGQEALQLAQSHYDAKRWMHDLETLYTEIVDEACNHHR
jgi:glycosyltransferase involved in cell wall biosynthesis